MSFTQLEIFNLVTEGQRLRDEGIQRAIEHADRENAGWSNRAANLFIEYMGLYGKGHRFKTEDVRIYGKLNDKIEEPPSNRAWGSVARKIVASGLIKSAGQATVTNPKAHCAFATLWEKI